MGTFIFAFMYCEVIVYSDLLERLLKLRSTCGMTVVNLMIKIGCLVDVLIVKNTKFGGSDIRAGKSHHFPASKSNFQQFIHVFSYRTSFQLPKFPSMYTKISWQEAFQTPDFSFFVWYCPDLEHFKTNTVSNSTALWLYFCIFTFTCMLFSKFYKNLGKVSNQ